MFNMFQRNGSPATNGAPPSNVRPVSTQAQNGSSGRRQPIPDTHHREPKVELELVVDFSKVKIRSYDGQLAATPEQQKLCCFLDDGRLLIAQDHLLDHHVLSYEGLLQRRNVRFSCVITKMSVIAECYQNGIPESGRVNDMTAMQREAHALLCEATSQRASDIHIRSSAQECEILFRIHGDLVQVRTKTGDWGKKLVRTFYQSMANVSDDTFKENRALDARIGERSKLPENVYAVRIASSPKDDGTLMVLRLLYNDVDVAHESPDMCDLGFSEDHRAMIQYLKQNPYGIIFVTGPTGSGKSTTLQNILVGIFRETNGTRNIITVEDPPEYPIIGAQQMIVANAGHEEERNRQFAESIRAAMRLDPDIIMVGETRDAASANMAFRAAMTGHQVWTTLHANDVMGSIDRLIDLGVSSNLVTDPAIVTGLLAQRLVKRLCPHCKLQLISHQHLVSDSARERIKRCAGADIQNVYITNKDGCEHCTKGTIGRTVVSEMITPDPVFMDFIRAGKKADAREYWLNKQKGMTFIGHTILKVKNGEVDPIEAEKVVGRLTKDKMLADHMLTVAEIAERD